MDFAVTLLVDYCLDFIKNRSGVSFDVSKIQVSPTRSEFEGDYTIVVFPFAGLLKSKPEDVARELGEELLEELDNVDSFNVVKGFLNIALTGQYFLKRMDRDFTKLRSVERPGTYLVEYSSPNTNKPLHLGHIRNILLGWSVSQILEAVGHQVVKTQVVNDRGIAICKSMYAWKQFAEGATPQSSGIKGDHFVGDYYVRFEQEFKREYEVWQSSREAADVYDEKGKGSSREAFFKKFKNQYFNEFSKMGRETRQMLQDWEQGDRDVNELWKSMNSWVYEGFEKTYRALGVHFDDTDYESKTYLLGKEVVKNGLEDGIFFDKPDGSVWINLEEEGMDEKLVLRADGTSVYITQDIGTAMQRYARHKMDHLVYVVADEQEYHFKALFATMKRLGEPYAEGLYHLSYGMVDLPEGKMKSREGTVVDADDLMEEVISEAKSSAMERGEMQGISEEEQSEIFRRVGLGALKFFIIKVNPRKRMVFDPKESVDMQGQTGPYIQNAYVRIQSIFRKIGDMDGSLEAYQNPGDLEKDILISLDEYSQLVHRAATEYDPSLIANYLYDLARKFHRFYHDYRIIQAESDEAKAFRYQLIKRITSVLFHGMSLLGIEMPERM